MVKITVELDDVEVELFFDALRDRQRSSKEAELYYTHVDPSFALAAWHQSHAAFFERLIAKVKAGIVG